MQTGAKRLQEVARLFRPVREEVISLLASRYVFRTVQEIVRRNTKLEGTFNSWIQVVYATASSAAVRRLAASRYRAGDASFIAFFDELLRDREDPLFDVIPRCLREQVEVISTSRSADGRQLALRRFRGSANTEAPEWLGRDVSPALGHARNPGAQPGGHGSAKPLIARFDVVRTRPKLGKVRAR